MKVIYNENGIITAVTNDPREKSDIETDISDKEIFNYKVDLSTKNLIYSPIVDDVTEDYPETDISVTTARGLINESYSFNFVTTLSDDSYYMPVSKQGTDEKRLFNIIVSDGAGVLNVSFKDSGIYYINENDLDTTIKINGESNTRFTLYIAE